MPNDNPLVTSFIETHATASGTLANTAAELDNIIKGIQTIRTYTPDSIVILSTTVTVDSHDATAGLIQLSYSTSVYP